MNKRKEKQMQILKNYFSFEENIATLKLVYDTFEELINPNFGDDKTEKLNDKLFSDIREAVSLLPRNYKLDLQIIIKDYGDYTVEESERIIVQNIELFVYSIIKDNNKKRAIGWSLIGGGAIVLVISYFLQDKELWFDLVNISGTLFVWEGAYTAFIERNLENREAKKLASSIRNITIRAAGKADEIRAAGKADEIAVEKAD